MIDTAKVFMSGRSQAVRLPKAYRFDCDEVEISRDGDAVLLRPRGRKPWADLTAALEALDDEAFEDLFANGREQPEAGEVPELDALLRE